MLLEAKLLIASGHVPVIAGMDDYEDEPIEASWSPVVKSYGYLDSVGRWIQVDEQEIAHLFLSHHVDEWCMGALVELALQMELKAFLAHRHCQVRRKRVAS